MLCVPAPCEAIEERWEEVLLQQGEVLVLVSTARHHGLPSPPGKRCMGHCSRSGPPISVICRLSRIQRMSTPTSPWSLNIASACWTGRAGRTCSFLGNCWCWRLHWRLGSGGPPGTWWTTSSAPPRGGARAPVCTHHPLFLPLRPRNLPRHRARGGHLDLEWGARDEGHEGGFNGRRRGGDVGT